MSLLCRSSTFTHPRSPSAWFCSVEPSMSEKTITTWPSAASLARSGRSTWAQAFRTSGPLARPDTCRQCGGRADRHGRLPGYTTSYNDRYNMPATTEVPTRRHSRPQRQSGRHDDEHSYRGRHAHRLEVRQPAEAQAVRRPGDGQARTQDNRSDRVTRGVVGGFPILAGLTRLSITAEQEYPVIGRSRDAKHRHEIRYERRESKDVMAAQNRDNSSSRAQP